MTHIILTSKFFTKSQETSAGASSIYQILNARIIKKQWLTFRRIYWK